MSSFLLPSDEIREANRNAPTIVCQQRRRRCEASIAAATETASVAANAVEIMAAAFAEVERIIAAVGQRVPSATGSLRSTIRPLMIHNAFYKNKP